MDELTETMTVDAVTSPAPSLSADEVANISRAADELDFYRTRKVWETCDAVSRQVMIVGLCEEALHCRMTGGSQGPTGFIIHRGEDGLRGYLLAEEGHPEHIPDIQERLNAFVAADVRADMIGSDLKAILEGAGVRPSGTRHWPSFSCIQRGRSVRPMRGDEFELVADAIAAVNQMAILLVEEPDAFWAAAGRKPRGGGCLVITVVPADGTDSDDEPAVAYSWNKHAPRPALIPDYRLTDEQTQAARKLRHDRSALVKLPVELYGFVFPGVTDDETDPYHPYALVMLEGAEGLIINHLEFDGVHIEPARAVDWILETLAEKGVFPTSFVVCQDDALATIANLSQALGVPMNRVGHLPHAVAMHTELLRSMMEDQDEGEPDPT